jgi:glycosyltransferase involved in cell wall biosynthesis
VLAQDFDDFEVLVVHDGPADDETLAVCEEFDELFTLTDVAFRLLCLEENSGYQCVPKNIGIWHAKGDYIAFLDDDNEWTGDHLSVLFKAIEEGHVWPDFVYGRRMYKFDKGFTSETVHEGESPFVEFNKAAAQKMSETPLQNFIDTSDAMVAKGAIWRLFLATGKMWNEELRRFGDWEFFVRGIFFSGWKGKGVDAIVQNYYWHGENLQLTRPAKETPSEVKA